MLAAQDIVQACSKSGTCVFNVNVAACFGNGGSSDNLPTIVLPSNPTPTRSPFHHLLHQAIYFRRGPPPTLPPNLRQQSYSERQRDRQSALRAKVCLMGETAWLTSIQTPYNPFPSPPPIKVCLMGGTAMTICIQTPHNLFPATIKVRVPSYLWNRLGDPYTPH